MGSGTCLSPSLRDPALVLSAIAQALGVREAGHRSLLEGIAHALREKEVLLILDNFEHVVEAAPLVSELLTRCPRSSTCLVTSRALLRVAGEHAFPVSPLLLPPAAAAATVARMPSCLRPYSSSSVARRRCGPVLSMTDANAGVIAAICRRLDGLPLAIELAAARVPHLTAAELATRLLDGKEGAALGVLTGGPRDAPVRQHTLRYAVAWSHDLLTPEERILFRRLAVFVGGFTLEAAEAVVNAEGNTAIDAVEGIAALLDQSLLQQEEAAGGASRYAMLETVREFALEQLVDSGEEGTVEFPPTRPTSSLWLNWPLLSCTRRNNRPGSHEFRLSRPTSAPSLAWLEQRGDVNGALRVAVALWRFWQRRGYWAEGRSWLVRLLAHATAVDAVEPATWAAALTGAVWLAHYQNDFAAVRTFLQEGLERYRRLGRADSLVEVLRARRWSPSRLARTGGRPSCVRRRSPCPVRSTITSEPPSPPFSSAWRRASWEFTPGRPPSPRKPSTSTWR